MVAPLTLDFWGHAKSPSWKLKYLEAESFKRLKNTSRLAGDRAAACSVLASRVMWLSGQRALHTCHKAVISARVLLVSASPFTQYLT